MKIVLCFAFLIVAVYCADDHGDDLAILGNIQKKITDALAALRQDFEKIMRSEEEYHRKTSTFNKLLVEELDVLLSKKDALVKHVNELIAKETDATKKWELQTELDEINVLVKHLDELDKKLKGSLPKETSDDVYADLTPEEVRKLIQNKTIYIRSEVLHVFRLANEYDISKKDEDKQAVIDAIDKLRPLLREAEKLIDDEVAKKVEDELHTWLLETESEGIKIMDKHLDELEADLKKTHTSADDDVYADEEWSQTIRTIRVNFMEAYVHFLDLLRMEEEHHKEAEAERASILADIDKVTPTLKSIEAEVKEEISHKHTNELFNFALNGLLQEVQLIEKELAALQARLKK